MIMFNDFKDEPCQFDFLDYLRQVSFYEDACTVKTKMSNNMFNQMPESVIDNKVVPTEPSHYKISLLTNKGLFAFKSQNWLK